jgi:hypothetical protein
MKHTFRVKLWEIMIKIMTWKELIKKLNLSILIKFFYLMKKRILSQKVIDLILTDLVLLTVKIRILKKIKNSSNCFRHKHTIDNSFCKVQLLKFINKLMSRIPIILSYQNWWTYQNSKIKMVNLLIQKIWFCLKENHNLYLLTKMIHHKFSILILNQARLLMSFK